MIDEGISVIVDLMLIVDGWLGDIDTK